MPLANEVRLFRITGRVQGVGYRFFVERLARDLAINGWVRNCQDGAVEVHAECTAARMDKLRAALAQGLPASRVEQVTEQAAAPLQCRSFTIEATR